MPNSTSAVGHPVIIGSSSSVTTTLKLHTASFAVVASSLTVTVTAVVPSSNIKASSAAANVDISVPDAVGMVAELSAVIAQSRAVVAEQLSVANIAGDVANPVSQLSSSSPSAFVPNSTSAVGHPVIIGSSSSVTVTATSQVALFELASVTI